MNADVHAAIREFTEASSLHLSSEGIRRLQVWLQRSSDPQHLASRREVLAFLWGMFSSYQRSPFIELGTQLSIEDIYEEESPWKSSS